MILLAMHPTYVFSRVQLQQDCTYNDHFRKKEKEKKVLKLMADPLLVNCKPFATSNMFLQFVGYSACAADVQRF